MNRENTISSMLFVTNNLYNEVKYIGSEASPKYAELKYHVDGELKKIKINFPYPINWSLNKKHVLDFIGTMYLSEFILIAKNVHSSFSPSNREKKVLALMDYIVNIPYESSQQERGSLTFKHKIDLTEPDFKYFDKMKLEFSEKERPIVALSGGNESVLSYIALQDLGYKPEAYTIKGNKRDSRSDVKKKIERSVSVANINIDDGLINSVPDLSERFITYNVRETMYLLPALMLIALSGVECGKTVVISGNEFDTCPYVKTKTGKRYYPNWGQAEIALRALSSIFKQKSVNLNIKITSIVGPYFVPGIVKMVANSKSPLIKNISSCFYPLLSEDGKYYDKPCNECIKCARTAACLASLGKDGTIFGYDMARKKYLEYTSWALWNNPEELEQGPNSYILEKLKGRKDSELPKATTRAVEYNHDDIHPILPDKLNNYFKNLLNK